MRGIVIALALMFVTTGAFANQERIDVLTKEAQELSNKLQQYQQASEQIRQRIIGLVAVINEYKQQQTVLGQLGLEKDAITDD